MCIAVRGARHETGPGMRTGDRRQAGSTYVLMLFAVVLVGYSLALLGETWRATSERDVREEREFVLTAYAQALRSYRLATPDGLTYRPQQLEDLLDDSRGAVQHRHLRRLYRDPASNQLDWHVRRDSLGIVAVCPRGEASRCEDAASGLSAL